MRCFFNLVGAVHDIDDNGHEVATMDEARVHAAVNLSEIIRDRPHVVWLGEEMRLEVTDEHRLVLFTIIAFGIDAPAVAGQPASFRSVTQHPSG